MLWSDETLFVVNKPAGLLVIPGGYGEEDNVRQMLESDYGRVWIVHRLDRHTSGVLVVARTAHAHRALNTQFEEHRVHKTYHALVNGVPRWDRLTIDRPLQPNGDRRHRTVVSERGKPSRTEVQVLERFAECALVEATPKTGRTHQIRAHLAASGYPIVADRLYRGQLLASQSIDRPALHALSIEFNHPTTQKTVRFEAPYPADLASTLDQLRNPHLAQPAEPGTN